MRILLVTLLLIAVSFSCAPKVSYASFGDEISSKGAMETEEFLSKVSDEEETFVIKGVVEEVCQMKGCWLTLRNDENESIRVTFKDYGFFVPKDIAGSEVILDGIANTIQQSEEMAKHYAEDAGKEYDETMTQEISFVARGVLVRENTQE